MKKFSMLLVLVTILTVLLSIGSTDLAHAKRKYTLVYYDGHMHSTYSDGSGSVEEIKATAQSRGLDVVIVTDHCEYLTRDTWDDLVADTVEATDENILVLPGFEITGNEGMFNRDHIVALNVEDPFDNRYDPELCPSRVWDSPPNPDGSGPLNPENITKWVDFIHKQKGIAVHVHPSGSTQLDFGVNHLEVYNQDYVDNLIDYAIALGFTPEEARGLAITLNNTALYGEEEISDIWVPFPPFGDVPLRVALYYASLTFTGTGQWLGSPEAPLSSWDDLLMAYVDGVVDDPIFALANSDSHSTGDGAVSTVGFAKNGVYVKGDLDELSFYKALKAGRSFATTGPSLNFNVNGELMGEEAYIPRSSAEINLSVHSESPTAIIAEIRIIKNGGVWQTIEPMSPSFEDSLVDDDVTADGYYRVEITSIDLSSGEIAFAWSNPVFVQIGGNSPTTAASEIFP